MTKTKITIEKPETEWTDWAEAISFISATLCETFTTATANGLFWSAFAISKTYPLSLERIGSEIKITANFLDIVGFPVETKLWAIMGWAASRNITVETD